MATAPKLDPFAESTVDRFAPHVHDLQEFFGARGVSFGSARDLSSFVARLESDTSFRDEMASMVRAVIYRERDGLSRPELIELLAMAATGTKADHLALPELGEAVRKLMTFVESVFRTRWNPGATVSGPAPRLVRREAEEAALEQEVAPQPTPAVHPMTDLFYRAQVVANGGVAGTVAEERKIESVPESEPQAMKSPAPAELPNDEQWHIPLEDFAGPEPERGSRAWLWIAGICALLLAFSAGLFVHQRMMMVPLRDSSQPYEAAPAEAPAAVPVAPVHHAGGTAVDDDWRARATKVRRAPAYVAAEPPIEADLEPRFMSPATIGASPALMESRLVYAPPAGYPALAKMTHVQGKVMVQAVVGKNGQVLRAEAISGHRLLRGAAVREVFGRRYRPYILDDRPRDVATIVTVDFRLK
ncbi:MAG TPA: energy transducer TonB [Acidobacteriaceae bacterium]|nr:energy transducer TonB [Acidobacteriaceae bacterium]